MRATKLTNKLPKMIKAIWVVLSLGGAVTAHAQWLAQQDPDWKEQEVMGLPTLAVSDQLVPLEMPSYLSLKYSIDTESIQVGQDGIVRYVVVAQSPSGARSVMFEGINCYRWEFKTYARMNADRQWSAVQNPSWRILNLSVAATVHALAFARQAACSGGGATSPKAQEIARMLKQGR